MKFHEFSGVTCTCIGLHHHTIYLRSDDLSAISHAHCSPTSCGCCCNIQRCFRIVRGISPLSPWNNYFIPPASSASSSLSSHSFPFPSFLSHIFSGDISTKSGYSIWERSSGLRSGRRRLPTFWAWKTRKQATEKFWPYSVPTFFLKDWKPSPTFRWSMCSKV